MQGERLHPGLFGIRIVGPLKRLPGPTVPNQRIETLKKLGVAGVGQHRGKRSGRVLACHRGYDGTPERIELSVVQFEREEVIEMLVEDRLVMNDRHQERRLGKVRRGAPSLTHIAQ